MTSNQSPKSAAYRQSLAEPLQSLSFLGALKILFAKLPAARRRAAGPLIALMLLGACAELVSLGALLPFLTIIVAPEESYALDLVRPYLNLVGIRTSQHEVYALAGVFAALVLSASIMRLMLLRTSQGFVFGVAYEIGVGIYSGSLAQPYSYHTQHNTSETISSINKAELVTNLVLMPLMMAIVAIIIATFIIVGLVVVNPILALVSGGGFIAIYVVIGLLSKNRLTSNGVIIAKSQQKRVLAMQEGLGGIRDVLIDGTQPVFVDTFATAEAGLRDARSRNALYANAPRFLVEGLGIILIVLVAVSIAGRSGGFINAIPALGALAFGAQKLLPLIQQVFQGWAQANGGKQVLFDVIELLNRASPIPIEKTEPLSFRKSIVLSNIEHRYARNSQPTLSGVNIEILKGARVGIVGRTGSGKSTLVDLIIGLLEPTAGEVRVDGTAVSDRNRQAWQKNIAHVPQAIFLADTSVAENIAFGVENSAIDMARVHEAAEQAELADVIAQLPHGYGTRVGERGIQLSGGQKQRLGIARALYKQASLLVFDEATSALDHETERGIMAAIERLDREITIIIIAHRVSTLKNVCFDAKGGGSRSFRFKSTG
jgi:ABC-type bacteriocin/lantibiotic exporter with double-glycine peptidase domain